jgi:hypothetical protein
MSLPYDHIVVQKAMLKYIRAHLRAHPFSCSVSLNYAIKGIEQDFQCVCNQALSEISFESDAHETLFLLKFS